MYDNNDDNDDDDDDDDDIVIMEDVYDEEEENNEPDNHNYSEQGIVGMYTNYGYTSHRTTMNEDSIDANDTVNTNKGTETNNSNNGVTKGSPNNINVDGEEVKLPSKIKALSAEIYGS